ncbi:MAG: dehydrogenase [Planctomycetota bacterium]|nr:MAG: dehydrogenase [Planctomycetota bacterium]
MVALGIVATATAFALADDWPQWRGPNRDGVWYETGIVSRFDGSQLEPVWRAKISGGYSGPTVAEGRVFVTDRITEPEEIERVHAFDAATGERLWTYSYSAPYVRVTYRTGPRASVTIADGRAYAFGTMGHLHCLDAATGKVLWKKIPGEDLDIDVPTWGCASAPLVEGDLLIVQIGAENGCITAFDRRTGEIEWQALDDPASYSAPIVIEQGGRRVLVCWTGERVVGLNPQTGELYWEYPFSHKRWIDPIISPVYDAATGRLFVSCFDDGAAMLQLTPDLNVRELWRRQGKDGHNTDAVHTLMGSPILEGDFIYAVDGYGQYRCLNAATGDRVWEDLTLTSLERWGTLHPVRHGDEVWMFNDMGELIITRLSPQGVEVLSRAKLLSPTRGQLSRGDGVTWSHPAFADGCVFNRNDEELICVSLRAGDE